MESPVSVGVTTESSRATPQAIPALVPVHIHGGDRSELSVFLALCRHRIAQGSRLLGQPLDLRRSSRRSALFTTDITDRFEIGEQFVEEGE
jgi:hypothetical protein